MWVKRDFDVEKVDDLPDCGSVQKTITNEDGGMQMKLINKPVHMQVKFREN